MGKIKKRFNIEFIEPSSDLAEGYIQKARDSLEEMSNVKKREWKIETAYYTMYQAVYALLTRTGIKCEVHTGTLEILNKVYTDYFSKEDFDLLRTAFTARKNSTYYVNREVSDNVLHQLMTNAPRILAKCRTILSSLDQKTIVSLREKIKRLF